MFEEIVEWWNPYTSDEIHPIQLYFTIVSIIASNIAVLKVIINRRLSMIKRGNNDTCNDTYNDPQDTNE